MFDIDGGTVAVTIALPDARSRRRVALSAKQIRKFCHDNAPTPVRYGYAYNAAYAQLRYYILLGLGTLVAHCSSIRRPRPPAWLIAENMGESVADTGLSRGTHL